MKKVLGALISVISIVIGCYLIYHGAIRPIVSKNTLSQSDNIPKQLLSPCEVFEPGKYIETAGIEISYNGEHFLVKNNREDMVRVLCSIVGVKKDGSYDTIQYTSFVGVDETQYDRDKSENGWAIEQYTNSIRPGETLKATFTVFDFNEVDSSYPKNDIDDDGYLDIVFTISPQLDETSIRSSSDDIKSDIYKIKDGVRYK